MSTLRVNNMTNVGGDGPTYAKGAVIQVVTTSTITEVTNTSSTLVDTTLTATITPKSVNSKILVTVSHPQIFKSATNGDNSLNIWLYRNAIALHQFNWLNLWSASALQFTGSTSTQYLDSPATTSAVTYKTMFANYVNGSGVIAQHRQMPSTITLMEIAA